MSDLDRYLKNQSLLAGMMIDASADPAKMDALYDEQEQLLKTADVEDYLLEKIGGLG